MFFCGCQHATRNLTCFPGGKIHNFIQLTGKNKNSTIKLTYMIWYMSTNIYLLNLYFTHVFIFGKDLKVCHSVWIMSIIVILFWNRQCAGQGRRARCHDVGAGRRRKFGARKLQQQEVRVGRRPVPDLTPPNYFHNLQTSTINMADPKVRGRSLDHPLCYFRSDGGILWRIASERRRNSPRARKGSCGLDCASSDVVLLWC